MKTSSNKSKTIGYWCVTIFLCLGMFAGGLGQVLHAKFNVAGMERLGYPLYVLNIIGMWKLAGVVVLLIPGWLLVKEWAYAGFFFLMTGASVSHIAAGDPPSAWIGPIMFVLLIVASWLLRPASRRLVGHASAEGNNNQPAFTGKAQAI